MTQQSDTVKRVVLIQFKIAPNRWNVGWFSAMESSEEDCERDLARCREGYPDDEFRVKKVEIREVVFV